MHAAAILQDPRLDAALLGVVADDPGEPPALRLEALRAAVPRHPEPSPAAFDLLIGRLGTEDDPLVPWPPPSWRAGPGSTIRDASDSSTPSAARP